MERAIGKCATDYMRSDERLFASAILTVLFAFFIVGFFGGAAMTSSARIMEKLAAFPRTLR